MSSWRPVKKKKAFLIQIFCHIVALSHIILPAPQTSIYNVKSKALITFKSFCV